LISSIFVGSDSAWAAFSGSFQPAASFNTCARMRSHSCWVIDPSSVGWQSQT
jgi:hypothetical protein